MLAQRWNAVETGTAVDGSEKVGIVAAETT